MKKNYRSKRSQAGEGELMVFGLVVLLCGLLSGSLFVFGWFKDTKDARLYARREAQIEKRNKQQVKFLHTRDPDAYMVTCQKTVFATLSKNISCSVLPESYGELDFLSLDDGTH